jgi:hypothetical protein
MPLIILVLTQQPSMSDNVISQRTVGTTTQIVSRPGEDVRVLSSVCDLALHRLQRLNGYFSAWFIRVFKQLAHHQRPALLVPNVRQPFNLVARRLKGYNMLTIRRALLRNLDQNF